MLDDVVSVNPNENSSIKADKKVFQLYTSTKKENGRLVAFNELKTFAVHLKDERKKALDEVRESEKWFKKKIEFLDEFKMLFRVGEPTEKDKKRIKELVESYPELEGFSNMFDEYNHWGSFKLATMIHFIDTNRDFFKRVDSVSLLKNAEELYAAILHFDFIHLLYERSKDLVQLVLEKGFEGNVKKGEFIRTLEEIKELKNKKPGPDTPEKLREDIRSIIEDVDGDEEYLYRGRLNISKTVKRALSHPMFYRNWIDEETAKENNGYSERQLHTLFTEEYEKMKS